MCGTSAFSVGAQVVARSKDGFWYRAKVIGKRGDKNSEFEL